MNQFSKFFSKDLLDQIFKIDCFEKTEEAFNKTHYPLSFNFHSAKENRDVLISESDLLHDEWKQWDLEKRRNSGVMIRPYVIWGATGTGKTELCRYLELNLKNTNEYLPIRVSKRELAMGGILGIAQSLSKNKLDITDALLKKHGGYEPVEFFKNILGIIASQNQDSNKIQIMENEGHEGEVYQYIAEQIVKNLRERADELAPGKDIEQFKSKSLFLSKVDSSVDRGIGFYRIDHKFINEKLYDQLVPQFYGINSVQKLLYNYIRDVNNTGKIPVFLFDDVTFVGDKINELIPVITDISADSGYICDFVIGTTTEFYKKHFAGAFSDTIQARISEIKLSPEGNTNTKSAEWLLPYQDDEGNNKGLAHFLEFCLRYINGSYTVEKRIVKGEVDRIYVDENDVYYPFTKSFMVNLYHRILHEMNTGQPISLTPRTIIKVLNHVMHASFDSMNLVSSNIEETFNLSCEYFYSFNDDDTFEKHKDYYCAIWWFGTHNDSGLISVSRKLLNNLDLINEANTIDPENDPVEYKTVSFIVSPENPTGGDDLEKARRTKAIDHSVEETKSRIKKWMEGSKDVAISKGSLQSGINKIFKGINSNFVGSKNYSNFINPSSSRLISKNDGGMYALKYIAPGNKQDIPFALSPKPIDDDITLAIIPATLKVESSDLVKDKSLYIYFTVNDYYNALRLGDVKDSDESAELQAKLLRSHIDEFHNVLRQQNLNLLSILEDAFGCSLDAFCLSAYIVLGKLLNPESIITNKYSSPDEILEIYAKRGTAGIERMYLNPKISNDYPTKELYSLAEGLFLSRFTLGGAEGKVGYVDYSRLEDALEEIKNNPYKIILGIKLDKIPNDFVISKGDYKFNKFVKEIQLSLSKILTSGLKFSSEEFDKYLTQIEKIGDDEELFNKNYLNFKKQLDVLSISDTELRSGYNKIYNGYLSKEHKKLLDIGKRVKSIPKLKTNEEQTIVEILSLYQLELYSVSNVCSFLNNLDKTIDLINHRNFSKVSYDLEKLRTAIMMFNGSIKEVDN